MRRDLDDVAPAMNAACVEEEILRPRIPHKDPNPLENVQRRTVNHVELSLRENREATDADGRSLYTGRG